MDIQTRLERLAQRRTDPTLFEAATKSYESYSTLNAPDAVRYIIGAMQPIDERYTRRTVEQGERVRDQLKKRLAAGVEYRFQGSVLTDTHIRIHSDIDLLVFVEKFIFLKKPLQPANPYKGDPVRDLRDLRNEARDVLRSAFPAATVEDSGSRSIEISGGSLARSVDVVPAAWLDTIEYNQTGNEVYRGVEVFHRLDGTFAANYPFKNVAEIDEKDRRSGGGLRKAARFMKTLKADSNTINLSSYDITAIAWNMPDSSLTYTMPWDIKIFFGCRDYLRSLVVDTVLRESLVVPDGSRLVFDSGHATVDGVMALLADIEGLAAKLAPIVESQVTRELKPGGLNYPVYYPEILGHSPLSRSFIS